MATEISRIHLENMTNRLVRPIQQGNSSTETFIRIRELSNTPTTTPSSATFVMERDDSMFSAEVNRWISGDNPAIIDSGIQSRVPTTQRSTLVTSSSLIGGGLWYIMAMILPLLSVGHGSNWRCTPSFDTQYSLAVWSYAQENCCSASWLDYVPEHAPNFSSLPKTK